MDLKNNQYVNFAVGCTVLVIFLRWWFSGDIMDLVEASQPPADGEVKSFSVMSVVWAMFFDAMVIVGASVIAFALNLWELLWAKTRGSMDSAPTETNDAVVALARAVASNDLASKKRYELEIRKPYAIAEQNAAIAAGDFTKAAALLKEIEALSGELAQ